MLERLQCGLNSVSESKRHTNHTVIEKWARTSPSIPMSLLVYVWAWINFWQTFFCLLFWLPTSTLYREPTPCLRSPALSFPSTNSDVPSSGSTQTTTSSSRIPLNSSLQFLSLLSTLGETSSSRVGTDDVTSLKTNYYHGYKFIFSIRKFYSSVIP